MATTVQPVYDVVAMDITSFCNLRCPFCLSDHNVPRELMDEEVFTKAVSLIPLAKNNAFLFSCLYEPTLHPSFLDYIGKIPDAYRDRVFFTTNLAKRIPDEVFAGLSTSGIHHINISVDSLDPQVYENLRRGARFSVFHDNLTRLVEIFSRQEDAPALYYISVVNKLNYREIASLVEHCATRYLGRFHDVREYWLLSHQQELAWCLEHKLSPEELVELKKMLTDLPYEMSFTEAGRDLGALLPDTGCTGNDVIDQTGWRDNLYHNSCAGPEIRIQADGKVEVLGRNVFFYLQDIADPVSFFSNFAAVLELDIRKTEELQRVAGRLIKSSLGIQAAPRIHYAIDEAVFTPKTLLLRGWGFHPDGDPLTIYFKIPGRQGVLVGYEQLDSPDVEAIYGPAAARARFALKVHLNYAFAPENLLGCGLEISSVNQRGRNPEQNDMLKQTIYSRARNWLAGLKT